MLNLVNMKSMDFMVYPCHHKKMLIVMMGLGMVKKCWWWGWKAMSSCCTLVINNWGRVCCKKWVHYSTGWDPLLRLLTLQRLSHSLKEDFHITHHRNMVTSKKIFGKTCHHILPSTRHSQVENLVTFEALFQISSQGVSDHDRYLWRCSTCSYQRHLSLDSSWLPKLFSLEWVLAACSSSYIYKKNQEPEMHFCL